MIRGTKRPEWEIEGGLSERLLRRREVERCRDSVYAAPSVLADGLGAAADVRFM